MGSFLRIVGVLWALLGLGNIVLGAGKLSETGLAISLIFNGLVFILPGLILLGIGEMVGKKKQGTVPAQAPSPARTTYHCPHCQQLLYNRVSRCPFCKEKISQEQIDMAIAAYAKEIASPPPEPPAATPSTESRLRELLTLKQRNLITEEEYEQKRAEILKGL